MATVPPGGIVTVPDGSGGAGAPLLTSQVINATWQNGQQRTVDAENRINTAILYAGPAPLVNAPGLDTSYFPPLPPLLTPSDPAEAKAIYDDNLATITELMTQGFANFQAQYFPDIQPATDRALQWLLDAMESEGTGIKASVEAQIYERERARIGVEVERNTKDAFSTWANRGFPLPPGALTSQIMQIRKGGSDALASSAREIAVKTQDVAIENARIAVREALSLRISALSAGLDYIRALILGPQTAMQLATGVLGLKNDFARTLTSLYSAQAAAAEPGIRLRIADADIKMRGEEANQRSQLAIIEARVRAAIEAAQQCATQAAAMLNGINASVGISGSDSSSL